MERTESGILGVNRKDGLSEPTEEECVMRRRRNRVMNRTRREVRQRLSRRVSENGMSRREWRCRRIPHRQRTTDWACHRWMMPSGPGSLRKNQASTPTRSSQPHSNGILPSQADARARIGHFIDWYNFRRPHKGIDHLAPADRFFGAAPEVLRTLRTQVAANALELARNGVPRPPFYVTGQVGGQNFSLHAEGERVFLTQEGQQRREVDLAPPAQATTDNAMPPPLCPDGSPSGEESGTSGGDEPAPGTSPLDDFLPAVGEHRPPDEPGDDAGEPQNGGVS